MVAKSKEAFTFTQFAAIAVCFVLQIIDGMDVLVVAYAGPQIMEEWGITKGTYGYIFSAGVAGMTMGSFFLTPFADIIGRRRAVLAAVTIIASSMLLTAFVTSIAQLLALRFIVGLGIGLAGPTLSTIGAEYSPPRYRHFVVSMIGAGYAVGAMLTGVVAAYIVPEYGWRAMFITAAAVTGIMLPVAFVMLPESLEFLLKKQPPGALAQANRLLGRLGRPQLDELPAASAEKRSGLGVGNLLVENRRRSTLGLWAGFFMVYATVYFLLGFVPAIVKDMGYPEEHYILAGTVYNLGGLVGIFVLGALFTRYRLAAVIIGFQVASAVFMVAFGVLTPPLATLLTVICVLGFFSQAGLIGMVAAGVRLYPTELRATGVGWGQGMGRAGAIIGPIIGGLLMVPGYSRALNFSLFAIPFVLAALAVMFIRFPKEPADP